MINLSNLLNNLKYQISAKLPEHINKALANSIDDLRLNKIGESALQTGDTLPSFALSNTRGEIIEADAILKDNDHLIIAFFRGSWCPYCNLEMKALEKVLPQIRAKQTSLVTISPQVVEKNAEMSTETLFGFDILSDTDNKYAKELGIAFDLQDFVIPYYRQLGINLSEYNGNDDNSLPIPAVFVIDKNRTIIFSCIDVDYTKRVNIDELLNSL
ncbi:AhpC/TSA family protein [Dysgonomonas sp. HDW5B]|uniref:peroxiredoxin-like family protein n=1 Tax=Dysgonomonas sp. HDW5B TaxID=2714927 RepID=UPI00140C492B|nr:peroxiredoxin-like family protein [Dysgonomonas sp. HDW5B]QIK55043.1 AhpC/TSA family protein [Dysgonomonas sp. HDW5B]